MVTLTQRAEASRSANYTLHFAGWRVTNTDVRALLVLARGLQETDREWSITYNGGLTWASWTLGTPKPPIDEF